MKTQKLKELIKQKSLHELTPLDITCTSVKCSDDCHCFKPKRRKHASVGVCRECGFKLENFDQLTYPDMTNIESVINALQHELIRHVYWHCDIDEKAQNYALRKGLIPLRETVREKMEKLFLKPASAYDGRQTSKTKNIIHYAQHATACCCRSCAEYWYGINKESIVSRDKINFFVDLIMYYIEKKMPELPDNPTKVPYIRTK